MFIIDQAQTFRISVLVGFGPLGLEKRAHRIMLGFSQVPCGMGKCSQTTAVVRVETRKKDIRYFRQAWRK